MQDAQANAERESYLLTLYVYRELVIRFLHSNTFDIHQATKKKQCYKQWTKNYLYKINSVLVILSVL